jgi:uncharacterized protein
LIVKSELEQLVALQNVDLRIKRIQTDIDAIPNRRAEVEKEFDQRAFEFREVETRRDTATKTRVRLEKEIAETSVKAERAERNLMSSKNEQEYGAAIRELDSARKLISQLETQVLEQIEIIEESDKLMQEKAPEVEKLRGEVDQKVKQFEETAKSQAEDLVKYRAERETLYASLPKNLTALYTRIMNRIRDGVAVAEAKNNSCSACFMALRPQIMAQIRRGDELIVCDNCSRILYYSSPESAQKSSPVQVQ